MLTGALSVFFWSRQMLLVDQGFSRESLLSSQPSRVVKWKEYEKFHDRGFKKKKPVQKSLAAF